MRFVTVRDLRTRPAQVWRELEAERELVITSNGKPIAILTAATERNLEESLSAIRRARALAAVERLQTESVRAGRDRLRSTEIEAEVTAARRKRR